MESSPEKETSSMTFTRKKKVDKLEEFFGDKVPTFLHKYRPKPEHLNFTRPPIPLFFV